MNKKLMTNAIKLVALSLLTISCLSVKTEAETIDTIDELSGEAIMYENHINIRENYRFIAKSYTFFEKNIPLFNQIKTKEENFQNAYTKIDNLKVNSNLLYDKNTKVKDSYIDTKFGLYKKVKSADYSMKLLFGKNETENANVSCIYDQELIQLNGPEEDIVYIPLKDENTEIKNLNFKLILKGGIQSKDIEVFTDVNQSKPTSRISKEFSVTKTGVVNCLIKAKDLNPKDRVFIKVHYPKGILIKNEKKFTALMVLYWMLGIIIFSINLKIANQKKSKTIKLYIPDKMTPMEIGDIIGIKDYKRKVASEILYMIQRGNIGINQNQKLIYLNDHKLKSHQKKIIHELFRHRKKVDVKKEMFIYDDKININAKNINDELREKEIKSEIYRETAENKRNIEKLFIEIILVISNLIMCTAAYFQSNTSPGWIFISTFILIGILKIRTLKKKEWIYGKKEKGLRFVIILITIPYIIISANLMLKLCYSSATLLGFVSAKVGNSIIATTTALYIIAILETTRKMTDECKVKRELKKRIEEYLRTVMNLSKEQIQLIQKSDEFYLQNQLPFMYLVKQEKAYCELYNAPIIVFSNVYIGKYYEDSQSFLKWLSRAGDMIHKSMYQNERTIVNKNKGLA